MKNNEYNIVNVSNEKNNFQAEFTTAQKAEFSSQSENINPIKDELNDNSVVNDKVEDNISKATRDKEEKREDSHEQIEEQLSSSSSSVASSTAASSAASGAAAASAGSAVATVVAAATVSVAAIGTIVGINVLPTQQTDLATFLTSEVTTNSINYSFSMPSQLLRYEEVSGDTQLGEKMVVATIEDGLEFKEEEYLVEYEQYDDDTFIFYHSFSGLTPDTAYALTLIVREENPSTEIPYETQLAYRTFRTDSVGNALSFDNLETTADSVSFSFIVTNEAAEYDPAGASMPSIKATISIGDSVVDEKDIEEVVTYDDNHLTGSASFTGLSASTKYTITLYVSVGQEEFKKLGSKSFTTQPKPSSGFRWGVITVENDETIVFRFYLKSSYIGFVEGGPTPTCYALVTLNGQEVTRSDDISYSDYEYATDACEAEGTINGLRGSTTYELTIYFVNGQVEEALGSPKEFTTKESTAPFYFSDANFIVTETTIAPIFYIRKSEVEQSATSDKSNIFIDITDDGSYTDSYNIPFADFTVDLSDDRYYVYPINYYFSGLNPGTTYEIFVRNGSTGVTYGSTNVTTEGTYTGFSWQTIETTTDGANVEFNISSTYLDYDSNPSETLHSLYIQVDLGTTLVDRYELNELNPDNGDNLRGTATISGLTAGNTYSLTLVRNVDGNYQKIGQSTSITIEETDPAFNGATVPDEVSFYSRQFTITLDFVDDPNNPQYDDLSIQLYSGYYDDSDKSELGSPIPLQSVTTEQTVTLPTIVVDEEEYEVSFDEVKSFVILANQDEVYHDDINFISSDPEVVVHGVNSDFMVTMDASSNELVLPLQIDYTDDYKTNSSFYVKIVPDDPQYSAPAPAAADEVGEYQLLTFYDAGDAISYISGGSTSFTLYVYKFDDQVNELHYESVEITEASINRVYGGSINGTTITEDDDGYGMLEIDLVYIYTQPTTSGPKVVFVNEDNEDESYTYNFNFDRTINIDMVHPASSTGDYTISDFSSLAEVMANKTFKIVIEYNDDTDTKTIQTGVSFTFVERI